jgi:hypothetical protein
LIYKIINGGELLELFLIVDSTSKLVQPEEERWLGFKLYIETEAF